MSQNERDEMWRLCREHGLIAERCDPGGRVLVFKRGDCRISDMDDAEDLAKVRAFLADGSVCVPHGRWTNATAPSTSRSLSYTTRDVPIRGDFDDTDSADQSEEAGENDSESTPSGSLRTRPSSGPPTNRVKRR